MTFGRISCVRIPNVKILTRKENNNKSKNNSVLEYFDKSNVLMFFADMRNGEFLDLTGIICDKLRYTETKWKKKQLIIFYMDFGIDWKNCAKNNRKYWTGKRNKREEFILSNQKINVFAMHLFQFFFYLDKLVRLSC